MRIIIKGIVFLFLCSCGLAQDSHYIDSLEKAIANERDTVKAKSMFFLASAYADRDPAQAFRLADELVRFSEQLNYKRGIAAGTNLIGRYYRGIGDYAASLRYYRRAFELRREMKDSSNVANTYLDMGNVYIYMGNYSEAASHLFASLNIKEKLNDSIGQARCFNGLGNCYSYMKDYVQSFENYKKAGQIYELLNDKKSLAGIINNIAEIFLKQKNYREALSYYERALELNESTGNKFYQEINLSNIGAAYKEMGNYRMARDYFNRALSIITQLGDKEGESEIYLNLAGMDAAEKNYTAAVSGYSRALDISKLFHIRENALAAFAGLSDSWAALGDYHKALVFRQNYIELKDSLLGEENTKVIREMQAKYEAEKKEQKIISLQKDRELSRLELGKKETDIKRQNQVITAIVAGLLLLLVLAFIIYRGYRQKKRSNEELSTAYRIIEEKSQVVEEKNKEILDSIHYAKRIQQVLFASDDMLEKNFSEHFVLYKPKDIVSGDFYWAAFAETPGVKDPDEKKLLLCVGDCTGHGVPGAFMSLLGISFLNRIIVEKRVTHPHLVLNLLRDEIVNALNPEGSSEETFDGMDAVLCCFDPVKNTLQFACANNPLWMIKNTGLNENAVEVSVPRGFTEYSPDKFPVGKFYGEKKSFRLHSTPVQKGDTIYLFTDGYSDQFGGPSGKKFKYRQMQDLILSVQNKTMKEQKQVLNDVIEKWKGTLEQVDDILIVGIRV